MLYIWRLHNLYIDGLVQDCSNSTDNPMESCTKQSIYDSDFITNMYSRTPVTSLLFPNQFSL